MTLPPFPVDSQTLDLIAAAVRPGPDAERSSLADLCTLITQLSGTTEPDVSYHHNDVIAALVDEVRRLRALLTTG